jgi:hypothetical protein
MSHQLFLSEEFRKDTRPSGPGPAHPTQHISKDASELPQPPKFLWDRITKYQSWLAKSKIDADGICAMMNDGTLIQNSRLKDRFILQVDILRVLQMKLGKDKTLIGSNAGESASWLLLHFSGKYKEWTLACCADHRKCNSTSVFGRSTLKDQGESGPWPVPNQLDAHRNYEYGDGTVGKERIQVVKLNWKVPI